ncbi:MAG: hypothetical protein J1F32_01680 [Erysipelotrichales bacterium]|nr:hypothetical protein [Erysipelotrichales bacterium]
MNEEKNSTAYAHQLLFERAKELYGIDESKLNNSIEIFINSISKMRIKKIAKEAIIYLLKNGDTANNDHRNLLRRFSNLDKITLDNTIDKLIMRLGKIRISALSSITIVDLLRYGDIPSDYKLVKRG